MISCSGFQHFVLTYPLPNLRAGASIASEWGVGYDDGTTFVGVAFARPAKIISIRLTGSMSGADGAVAAYVYNDGNASTDEAFSVSAFHFPPGLPGGSFSVADVAVNNSGKEVFLAADNEMAIYIAAQRFAVGGNFFVTQPSIQVEGYYTG